MSRVLKTKLSPRSALSMHIIYAIALRLALRGTKAMITHMGFHAMLSCVWPEGCAAQVVNPLNAFSLGCRSGAPLSQPGPHPRGRPGGRRRAAVAARLPGDRCRMQRGHAATERSRPAGTVTSGPSQALSCARPLRKLKWTLPCTSVDWRGRGWARESPLGRVAGPAWSASLVGAIAGFCPIRPICAVRPNAAPHPPRRAVITDPFSAATCAVMQVFSALSLSRLHGVMR